MYKPLVVKFEEDGKFGIRDTLYGDCQTYELESERDLDFEKIKDDSTLSEVFGYEVQKWLKLLCN